MEGNIPDIQKSGFQIYAGIVVLIAIVLGGGTQQHLWSDQLIKIFMLPLVLTGFANIMNNRLGNMARLLVFLVLAILIMQFIPVGLNRGLPVLDGVSPAWQFFTATPYNALDAAVTTLSLVGIGLYVATLSDHDQLRLVRYMVLGFMINVLVSIIQLSFSAEVEITGILPFAIASGMFANENHFSSLIFTMIPLLAWRFIIVSPRHLVFIVLTLLTLALLFAIGSRVGMVLSSFLAVFCYGWFAAKKLSQRTRLFGLLFAGLIVSLGFYYFDVDTTLADDLRSVFLNTTWQAFKDHWLLGTGLGSFVVIYPMYEPSQNIINIYANHAHNDYIELMLEIGIIVIPVIGLFAALIVSNLFRSGLAQAAGISVIAIMIHSTVEYPLRSMAIATVFVIFSAIVMSKNRNRHPDQREIDSPDRKIFPEPDQVKLPVTGNSIWSQA